MRGLKSGEPIPVSFLDDAEFLAEYHRRSRPGLGSDDADRAFWAAFGFSFSPIDPIHVRDAVASDVIGFYSRRDKRVFVRKIGGEPRLRDLYSLAHEVEHALQEQSFSSPEPRNEDAAIALRSLSEGDAVISMLGLTAALNDQPVRAVLYTAGEHLRKLATEGLLKPADSADVDRAPAIVRARFEFPYAAGTTLAIELYRAGGFDLVNQAFAHPPVSTEQVLHIQKYLDGEAPIDVPPPLVPNGWKVVTKGTLGELGIRALLEPYVGASVAATTATGWGGDSYLVAANPAGGLALLWSTIWDDDTSASRFKQALDATVGRWPHRAEVADAFQVEESLRRVVLVRGIEPSTAAYELAFATLALPVPEASAASPPLGTVKLAPAHVGAHVEARKSGRDAGSGRALLAA